MAYEKSWKWQAFHSVMHFGGSFTAHFSIPLLYISHPFPWNSTFAFVLRDGYFILFFLLFHSFIFLFSSFVSRPSLSSNIILCIKIRQRMGCKDILPKHIHKYLWFIIQILRTLTELGPSIVSRAPISPFPGMPKIKLIFYCLTNLT